MKHPSQEDLLGYVLGALDAQEQREVQQLIDADPELEEKLLEIKTSLAPLEHLDGGAGPRPGLARRTSEMVASFQKQLAHEQRERQPITDQVFADALASADYDTQANTESPRFKSAMFDRVTHPGSWSLSDMLVAVASIAVLAAIMLPAVSYTRFNSRVVECQNNLRSLGTALLAYSDANKFGKFPEIPSDGNLAASGVWAVELKECGFIEDDKVALCTGRSQRDEAFCIPSLDALENATCCRQLDHLHKTMAGDYGYSLGYVENNQYHCASNEGSSHFVVLADMPSQNLVGRRSGNHSGRGQNCLFGDCRVEFVRGHAYGEDPIFENDHGIVAPGANAKDSVIAPSHLPPNLHFAAQE